MQICPLLVVSEPCDGRAPGRRAHRIHDAGCSSYRTEDVVFTLDDDDAQVAIVNASLLGCCWCEACRMLRGGAEPVAVADTAPMGEAELFVVRMQASPVRPLTTTDSLSA